jgi:hypothetical protein
MGFPSLYGVDLILVRGLETGPPGSDLTYNVNGLMRVQIETLVAG